ncbi:MAG TPA: hypothetical protein DCY88_32845 [Cyanobacteria bacterium UBA11372]|nr:hypothetical protein [Cyanobacteria bacterium UBA11372]
MNMYAFPDRDQTAPSNKLNKSRQNLQLAQEKIYSFFLEIVHNWEAETVFLEFKHLFLDPVKAVNSSAIQALYEIIFFDDEAEFRNTIKRTCYILINNWWAARQYHTIQKLIRLFTEIKPTEIVASLPLNNLNIWIQNFVNSKDYEELKLFASAFENRQKGYWSHRYTSYLLAAQYVDLKNPIEQREAAKELAKHLKEKFKRDLAMYTAHSQSTTVTDSELKNPTRLGDEALRLIKKIVAKRGLFSYANLANIFANQNQHVSYKQFKKNLQKYIFYSLYVNNKGFTKTLKTEIGKKLEHLYEEREEDTVTTELTLRTCNQVIECLTTENHQEPSLLLILIISQNETLTLAIILLKIVLFCQNVRANLEARIANLIQYYEKLPEEDCWGVIQFLEVLNLVFTVYTEDVEYNLVNIKNNSNNESASDDLDGYRVFSQLKCDLNLKGANLSGTDLHGADLSGVNLSTANLSGANLSHADLSNAKLSSADLSKAMLNSAELIAADLNNANLSGASLRGADLRRTNLSDANLSNTNLIVAKLRMADLRRANLKGANLGAANAPGVNLSEACLNLTHLRHADLSGADLSGANLSHADLSNADLSGANLSHADLSHANLRHATLMNANFRYANLNGADMGRVDLSGADMSDTDLSRLRVEYARFHRNLGLSEETKQILRQRRAIVEDDLPRSAPSWQDDDSQI